MQTTTTAIRVPESFDPANPQDVAAARSPVPTIRDRSAKQPALPYKKPARPFVSRCFEVKLPCVSKMVYISLAHRCKVWTEGDTGTTGRIGRSRIAADAGLTLTTLKVHLSILVSAGLISIKRTGRTNDYTVRVPSLALKDSNRSTTANLTGHQSHVFVSRTVESGRRESSYVVSGPGANRPETRRRPAAHLRE